MLRLEDWVDKLTRIISSADRDKVGHGVLDKDAADTLDAELVGEGLVGQVELASTAFETTNGFAEGTLGLGPLRLLVTGRAGIRTHGSFFALASLVGGVDGTIGVAVHGDMLDARPTTKTKVLQVEGAVLVGEAGAIDFTVGE